MNNVISCTHHSIPHFSHHPPPLTSSFTTENSPLRLWHQARFCDETGLLLDPPNLTPRPLSSDEVNKHTELLLKPLKIGTIQLTVGKYLRELQTAFPQYQLYLRGSYASYILNPLDHLRTLIDRHIEKQPETREMMEMGWKALIERPISQEVPGDADWALLSPDITPHTDLIDIKERLIALHAKIGRISAKEAKDYTFGNLKIASKDPLSLTDDPIVIATLRGELANDLLIGSLVNKPYLFSRDNRYLSIDLSKPPQTIQGCFWQGVFDHSLQIVRLEKRHEEDLRALMTAFKYLSQGFHLVCNEIDLKNAMEFFAERAPAESIANAILHKIAKEPFCGIIYLLHIFSRIKSKREEIWHRLYPHIASHLGCAPSELITAAQFLKEFAQFQKGVGLLDARIPFPDEEIDQTPLKLQLKLKKQLLFQPGTYNGSGIYADWQAICSRLHRSNAFNSPPEELFRFTLTLLREQSLSEEEKRVLADLLDFQIDEKSILTRLLSYGALEITLPTWLEWHHQGNWKNTLEVLLSLPLAFHKRDQLKSFFESYEMTADLFFAAFSHKLFQPDEAALHLFLRCYSHLENEALTVIIRSLAPLIPSDRKLWLAKLWMECYQLGKIDIGLFQERIERWMESDLSIHEKTILLKELLYRFGIAVFNINVQRLMFPIVQTFSEADLQTWFKGLVEVNPEEAAPFLIGFQAEIQPILQVYLEELLTAEKGDCVLLLAEHLPSPPPEFEKPIIEALRLFPQKIRIEKALLLPFCIWETLSTAPDLFTFDQRNELLVHLLRKNRSALLLFKLEREQIDLPEQLRTQVMQEWEATKTISLSREAARNTLKTLLDAIQVQAFFSLLDKLPKGIIQPDRMDQWLQLKCWEWLQEGKIEPFIALLKRVTLSQEMLSSHLHQLSKKTLDILLCKLPDLQLYLDCFCALSLDESQKGSLINHLLSLQSEMLTPILVQFLFDCAENHPGIIQQPARLVELLQNEGEKLYRLFNLFHLPMPSAIPPQLREWLLNALPDQVKMTDVLPWISCKGAHPLIPKTLDAILQTAEISLFKVWLEIGFSKLNPEEKSAFLPQLKNLTEWMEALMFHLLKNLHQQPKEYLKEVLNQYLSCPAIFETFPIDMVKDFPLDEAQIKSIYLLTAERFKKFTQSLFNEYFNKNENPSLLVHLLERSLELELESLLFPHAELILSQISPEQCPKAFLEKAKDHYLKDGTGSFLWLTIMPLDYLNPANTKRLFHLLSNEKIDLLKNKRAELLASKLVSEAIIAHKNKQLCPADYAELTHSFLKLFPFAYFEGSTLVLTHFFKLILTFAYNDQGNPPERIALFVITALYGPAKKAEQALESLAFYMPVFHHFTIFNLDFIPPLLSLLSNLSFDSFEALFFKTELLTSDVKIRYLQYLEFISKHKPEVYPHRIKALIIFMKAQFDALERSDQKLRSHVLMQLIAAARNDRSIDLTKPQYVKTLAKGLSLNAHLNEASSLEEIIHQWIETIKKSCKKKTRPGRIHLEAINLLFNALMRQANSENFRAIITQFHHQIELLSKVIQSNDEIYQKLIHQFLTWAIRSPFFKQTNLQLEFLQKCTHFISNASIAFYFSLLLVSDYKPPPRPEYDTLPSQAKQKLVDDALILCGERSDETAIDMALRILSYSLSLKGDDRKIFERFEKVILLFASAGRSYQKARQLAEICISTLNGQDFNHCLEIVEKHKARFKS